MTTVVTSPLIPAWTNLPLEIWTMIMCLMLGPSHIGPMWFNFRTVCRTFKDAIEVAVRIKVLPNLRLRLNIALDLDTIPDLASYIMFDAALSLDFTGLCTDTARATFRLSEENLKEVSYFFVTGVEYKHPNRIGIGSSVDEENAFIFNECVLHQARRNLEHLASIYSIPGPLQVRPPIILTTCATRLLILKSMKVNTKRLEISLYWKSMISALVKKEGLIAETLKAEALNDVKRESWMNGTLSRKGKALKLMLSSSFCRQERFERSFQRAIHRRNDYRPPNLIGDSSAVPFWGVISYPKWGIFAFDQEHLWYHD